MSQKFKHVISISNGINIFVDHLNWILQIGNHKNRTYFHTLDAFVDELFDMKLIRNAESKTIKELRKLILDTRKEVREDVEAITSKLTEAQKHPKYIYCLLSFQKDKKEPPTSSDHHKSTHNRKGCNE